MLQTQIHTGQQAYEARERLTTRANDTNDQTTKGVERSNQHRGPEGVTRVTDATFTEQKKERVEKMLAQASKAIL